MIQTSPLYKRIGLLATFVTATAFGSPAFAASTGTASPYTPQGSGTPAASGDYVTTNNPAGLNTFYRYFIEVPSGLARLRVQIWDADVGAGGAAEAAAGRDRGRGTNGAFSPTMVTYTLLRPDASTAATLTCSNTVVAACPDNAWTSLLDSMTAQNTAAGHWELRVDESSTVTGGDDINAFGVRADDGDATSGGTELPIYIDSQNEFGVNAPTTGQNSRAYTVYPYVTSGCTAFEQDFDYDSNQTDNVGSIVFASRTGATTQTLADTVLSTNNSWKQNTINGWTSDAQATDYGIWSMVLTIKSYNDPNSGINGNYTTVYVGNSSSAAPAPTANPVPNAFRIYLPTDAGAAPVKPYVEQFVRYLSGPNPPTVNVTQRDTVTVTVVNPTAKAITFSATNLVTANVPGVRVLYAGGAQKSQGTITAQPAVGGFGNITWNPGTVAAGATAGLSWNVDVKPTVAGQRNPAVGTVASGNGTKAVWVDETGNTTQARATYTFGPLCEVAVNQGMLTEAVITSLDAFATERGVAVEWRTASEAGTIGFDLYRRGADGRSWVKVNHDLLLGLLNAPQGGTYRFVDEGAAPREPQTYRLVEVAAGGKRRAHGPFLVRPDWSRKSAVPTVNAAGIADSPDVSYVRAAHPATAKTLVGPLPNPGPLPGSAAEALHVTVHDSGLYYLATADLASQFGTTPQVLGKAIANGQLNLSKAGQPVAWHPDVDLLGAHGLYFYGEALSSLYTRDNVYRLELTRGQVMSTVQTAAPTGSAPTAFAATLHAEQNLLPATALAVDPDSDYWFWDFVSAGDPTYGSKSFPLDAPGATGPGSASLTVHLRGASNSGVAAEHHPSIALNGTVLGDGHFQGITGSDLTFAVDPALLKPAGNTVAVTGLLDAGVPYSIFYVNSFDLTYPRTFQAAGGALAFTTTAAGPLAVAGFGDAAVRLVDVTDPVHPRWIAGSTVAADPQGGFDLTFRGAPAARYLAAATAGLKTPVAVTPFRTPRLRSTANHANLVVLAGTGLHDAAQRLADYRTAQGLDSMVVDWDEVTDEFAHGLPDPHAITTFLTYARSSWRTAPRYLVLAGAGTVDYRNLLGFGGEILPPIFVATDDGLFPSDSLLADLVGNDGLPDLAVGRIPAHSAAELDAYVDKLAGYESGADGGWVGNAVALADAPDRGADFGAGSDRVAALFPTGYTLDRIYLGSSSLEDARSRLFHDLQAGASLVDYMGHGGLDRLASGGLLASSDVASLGNGPRLPLVTAWTCAINRFAVPGVSSLGELLVNQVAGGAAAVWAPSGLSVHSEAQLLAEHFYRHLGDPDRPRLGDVVLRALQDFTTLGGSKSMIQIYNLLGDPALRVRQPTPAAGTGTSGPNVE